MDLIVIAIFRLLNRKKELSGAKWTQPKMAEVTKYLA